MWAVVYKGGENQTTCVDVFAAKCEDKAFAYYDCLIEQGYTAHIYWASDMTNVPFEGKK